MYTNGASLEFKNIEEKLNHAIKRGIAYLDSHQLANGEFILYMSDDDAMQEWNLPDSTIFPAALIGTCLLSLRGEEKVENILMKAAYFLHYQMDRAGTWNHYTILHRWRKLCPQDLDDTACVSYFLKKMGFDIPTKSNQQLAIDNRRSDGLFYTWITFRWRFNKNLHYWYLAARELKHFLKSLIFWHTHQCTRYDVDAVVNANILHYMEKRKETEAIIPYLVNIIKTEREGDCDTWYRNEFTVYYFICRNMNNGFTELNTIKNEIIDRILEKQNPDGSFGVSVLDTALGVSSLIYSGYKGIEIEKGIKHIIETQHEYGNWDRWAFYYGGPKKLSCFGSEELTTGFCLEALANFKNLYKSE
ncbi:hypothetical protein [Hwangdonia lutea]|uniref:Uncharacterized protein n=1 Tax=Hwangdonia lutea TaxID=3075823 RepID=A0AA97EMZ0_9FLAO|nr:hypothetical protein [Hwangdonia sp. SCSIO 19198]WOD43415.1 hypothetical protein RNZ46_15605 [Hwangdonia sp. SCSIO 19198]